MAPVQIYVIFRWLHRCLLTDKLNQGHEADRQFRYPISSPKLVRKDLLTKEMRQNYRRSQTGQGRLNRKVHLRRALWLLAHS